MQSESAKDCRLKVQDLNINNTNVDYTIEENVQQLQELVDYTKSNHIHNIANDKPYDKTSKWTQFLDEDSDKNDSSVEKLNQEIAVVNSCDDTSDLKSDDETQHQCWKRQKLNESIQDILFSMETKIHCKKKVRHHTEDIENYSQKETTTNLKIPAKQNIFENNSDDLDLNF